MQLDTETTCTMTPHGGRPLHAYDTCKVAILLGLFILRGLSLTMKHANLHLATARIFV